MLKSCPKNPGGVRTRQNEEVRNLALAISVERKAITSATVPVTKSLRMQIKDNDELVFNVDGEIRRIQLLGAFYAKNLPFRIIFLSKIEERGYDLRYDGHLRSVIFDLHKDTNNVIEVRIVYGSVEQADACVVAAVDEAVSVPTSDDHLGNLLDFHLRLSHLAYDTVGRMASEPASGMRIADRDTTACFKCAKGK
ncbi:hypothetical protein KXD40_000484 [Peronospora effusa]|nr:hypothetical protein KXD40_000484 [Peronospora effusa]